MTKITFGFTLPQLPTDQARRISFMDDIHSALKLIAGHFDSVRCIDHLTENHARGYEDIESFTTLAYLAALHPELKFGQTVICQSFRNPALVAKMGATFQFLSGGRFLLGIGAGGNEAEHRAFGYDFPSARVRVEQLEEALQIIRAMWTEPEVTFSGAHYQVNKAVCEPKPALVPPIMVGAFKPRMMRITAKYADEWNVASIGSARYQRLADDFERACADVGRDPATIKRSWGGGCICAPSQAEAMRLAGGRYSTDPDDDFDFVGTPGQICEQMRSFIEMGVSSFLVDCGGFPNLTTLELLICDVLPALNG